jgi:hypothetical protein
MPHQQARNHNQANVFSGLGRKHKAGAVRPLGLACHFVLSGGSIHMKEAAGFCGADGLPIKMDCWLNGSAEYFLWTVKPYTSVALLWCRELCGVVIKLCTACAPADGER